MFTTQHLGRQNIYSIILIILQRQNNNPCSFERITTVYIIIICHTFMKSVSLLYTQENNKNTFGYVHRIDKIVEEGS